MYSLLHFHFLVCYCYMHSDKISANMEARRLTKHGQTSQFDMMLHIMESHYYYLCVHLLKSMHAFFCVPLTNHQRKRFHGAAFLDDIMVCFRNKPSVRIKVRADERGRSRYKLPPGFGGPEGDPEPNCVASAFVFLDCVISFYCLYVL